MPTTLDIFISSKMVELKEERDAIFKLIPSLDFGDIKLHAWVFEEDAGAVGRPIRDVYLNALQKSALYLGLFWQQYGEYTIDEFDRATEWGIEQHVYVKDVEADKRAPELTDFLNKHGSVTSGITAKWFKTTDELCAAVQRSIENWISDRLRFRSGSSAIHATHPDDLTEKPEKLFGRDALLAEVRTLLEQHQRVLLQGFGGMGKTALAATLAARWITDGKGSVLWLKAGSAELDALAEALARPFNASQAVASQTGDAKLKVLRDVLRASGATLLVLDDCWSSKDLLAILKSVPGDMALLATSRQRYPLAKIRSVDELAPSDALDLLAYHSDRTFTSSVDNQSALALCDLLGHHAFAVEIAGKTLKANSWSPSDLHQRIKTAPHTAEMPLDFAEAGRENVAKLLEVSLNALDESTRNVFLAFGAFFAPQLTSEMLQLYFDFFLSENDDSGARITSLLDTLHLHGLAEPIPATAESIITYRIHDLAYSYARAQNVDDQHHRALQACLSYTEHYNVPSLANFAALRPELDNLLTAANWAFEAEQYAVVEQFAWNLYRESEILDYAGFYTESIRLLTLAAQSAVRNHNKQAESAHLGHLGNAYSDLGQVQQAIDHYQQALIISREIGDRRGEGNHLGSLGNA
ncbi:MAG: DUF4062 domain-containing protein, partial [Anaerolineae bacterium]|nr:DUF4062 domain-containing protein [Anaerolineae bacterium]